MDEADDHEDHSEASVVVGATDHHHRGSWDSRLPNHHRVLPGSVRGCRYTWLAISLRDHYIHIKLYAGWDALTLEVCCCGGNAAGTGT